MNINLLIAPYRDGYFYHKYGAAVRDLQFLKTIQKFDFVENVTILNRPISILEVLTLRKFVRRNIGGIKSKTINHLSNDFFGALQGRGWFDSVYYNYIGSALTSCKRNDCLNVFLDFLPIGDFDSSLLNGWLYWYDFIDNFSKHNRFTDKQKELVKNKYDFVSKNADYVTFVSQECMVNAGFSDFENKSVVTNKIYFDDDSFDSSNAGSKEARFDFGFIGFVTDKFDAEFVLELSKKHTIAIFGTVLDKKIKKKLSVKNITFFGAFKYQDVPRICSSFKVGLLPYLLDKSHDGSPLKLYEYIKYNIPCLTSIDYELSGFDFIVNYNSENHLDEKIINLLNYKGDSINSCINDNLRLDCSLHKIFLDIGRGAVFTN